MSLQKYNFSNFHPAKSNIPFHIGIIPDGTRRWAIQNNIPLYESYKLAMDKLIKIVAYFFDSGVREISIYFSSEQNFKRSSIEIEQFCRAETYFCEEYISSLICSRNVQINFVGNKELIPKYFLETLVNLEKKSISNKLLKINLLVAYNPFYEIKEAINNSPTIDEFPNFLKINTPLDLIIRTSDAVLLSNFLLIQSGFARIYNISKLFNDTEMDDYKKIFSHFYSLERKYGE
jgi:undecaprenyl diphosphate synthase